MASSTEARHLRRIRAAIVGSKTKPTINTIVRDTDLDRTLVERLVRQHHLDVAWRARDTTEAESRRYIDALSSMQHFCEKNGMNFRRSVIEALHRFKRSVKHSSV